MLDVGLIGLGPDWETRYRSALTALRSRLRVKAVHLPVASRAEMVAAEFRCDVAASLSALVDRTDLRGFLILDTGWQGVVPFLLTSRRGKAAFLSQAVLSDVLQRLPKELEQSAPVMPELPLRYAPVTQRLRELTATSLGRIRRVELHAENNGTAHLAQLIDWCRALLGHTPWRVVVPAAGLLEVHVQRKDTIERIRIHAPQSATVSPGVAVRGVVTCESGGVEMTGAKTLTWWLAGPGQDRPAELRSESLTSDRESVQVMLDHFSRRVAGALVPVPTLDDLWTAHRLAEWARKEPAGSALQVSPSGILG